jgi:Zn-finger nucleic acid-binding protein
VHVDYCGTCHGIFLDRGELQQAIDAVRARDRNTTPKQLIAAAISAATEQQQGEA